LVFTLSYYEGTSVPAEIPKFIEKFQMIDLEDEKAIAKIEEWIKRYEELQAEIAKSR
jgi:hypothetical protein